MEEFQSWKERITYTCYVKDQSTYHPKGHEGDSVYYPLPHYHSFNMTLFQV